MTKTELSEKSGVSISFLSDLTTGKGNPSLEVMSKIAGALKVPLAYLLESTDLDESNISKLRDQGEIVSHIPKGYEYVFAVLPEHKAFLVKKWADDTKGLFDLINK